VKRIAVVILLLAGGIGAKAQSELTFPFMGNVFQNTYLNPAVKTEHSVSIGLPALSSIQFQMIHNGFVPHSFLKIEGNTLRIIPDKLDGQLRNRNMLFANADLDLFHLKLRIQNWDVWYGIRQNHEVALFYPKSMISLLIAGNAQPDESNMDLTPLGVNGSLYREHTLGASTDWGRWTFGGRVSLLHGLTNVFFKPQRLEVSIEDDMYALGVNSNATLKTSGIPGDSLTNINIDLFKTSEDISIGSFADFRNFLEDNYAANYLTRFRNPGFALSGAVSYKYDSRTTFTFAFSDLGFISWRDSTKSFSINGQYEFKGLDLLSEALAGNEVSSDTLIKDFVSNFDTQEDFGFSYRTWLHPKFYLSASYQLAQRTHVGVNLYAVVNRRLYPAFTVGITQGLGRVFNVALSASMNQRTLSNIGFGLMVKPGPFQFYLLADNLYAPLVDPLTFTNVNLRVGVNMVFGRVKTPQGLPYK
jgi:hypothetical protein